MALTSQSRQLLRSKLEDERTFGTVLLAILMDEFGTEMFEWEPETIRMDVASVFGAKMPQLNEDKVWSLITAMTTNQFYVSLEIFTATCDVLSNSHHNFSVLTPNTPFELAWGVTEVLLNDPFDDEHPNSEFSNEIEHYTGLVLSENGLLVPPTMLAFAEYKSSNPVLDLDTAFLEDSTMFEAAYGKQLNDKYDIEATVQLNLKNLIDEVASLPLQNVDPKFRQKLQSA